MKPEDLRIGGIYEMKNGIRRRIESAVPFGEEERPAIKDHDITWTRPEGEMRGPRYGRCWCYTFSRQVRREIDPNELGILL